MAVEQHSNPEAVEISRTIGAPRGTVFEAWTDPEILKQWHAPGDYTVAFAEADVRVGGRYRISMQPPGKDIVRTVTGEYKEVVPNERLVYTWTWEEDIDEVGETLVTVEFRDRGESTELLVRHERLRTEVGRTRHREGWLGTLSNLEAYFA